MNPRRKRKTGTHGADANPGMIPWGRRYGLLGELICLETLSPSLPLRGI
jgi:hypothetical protein